MIEIAEFFKQFGPTGLTIIMMGGGLVYLTKWLRDRQEKSDAQHDLARREFIATLKEQQTEHRAIIREVVAEFKMMHSEHGEKIDELAVRIDRIDDHVRGKM
jgi:hypothetical protein